MKRLWWVLPLMLLASGPRAALFSDDEARQGVEKAQKEIEQLKAQAQQVDTRLAGIEQSVRSQGVLDLLNQIEQLRQEVAKLRGQVEELRYSDEASQKRQKDFYVDLDTRLRRLEQGGAATQVPGGLGSAPGASPGSGAPTAAGMPGQAPAAGVPGAAPPVAAETARTAAAPPSAAGGGNSGPELRAYDAAYNLFKIGNYQGAIAGFQNFIKVYPNSVFTPNAHYWIGNSHFNLRDYKSAIATQQKLVSAYPDSPKAPDAMLNVASCQQELGDAAGSKKTLEDLLEKYPASDAAQKAKRRLAGLR